MNDPDIDIWQGRCRDCFEKRKDITPFNASELMFPVVLGFPLCSDCIEDRSRDFLEGKPPRPIGIPADRKNAKWVDLVPTIVVFRERAGGGYLFIRAKMRVPTTYHHNLRDADMRMRLGDNLWWEAVASLQICEPNIMALHAQSNVRLMIHYRFEPHDEMVVTLNHGRIEGKRKLFFG